MARGAPPLSKQAAVGSIWRLTASPSIRQPYHQKNVPACMASTALIQRNVRVSQQHWKFLKISLQIQCPWSFSSISKLHHNPQVCRCQLFHHRGFAGSEMAQHLHDNHSVFACTQLPLPFIDWLLLWLTSQLIHFSRSNAPRWAQTGSTPNSRDCMDS